MEFTSSSESWEAARHSRASWWNSLISLQCIMTGDSWCHCGGARALAGGRPGCCRAEARPHGCELTTALPDLSVAVRRGRADQTPTCSLFTKDVQAP